MHSPKICLRRGSIAAELLVAASLLVCMIGILTPLTVRTSRLWRESRQVRLAMGELSNQLDVLTSLDPDALAESLEDLAVSEEAELALPNANLRGEKVSDEHGTRLVLKIDWDRPVKAVPLALVGWIDAAAVESDERSESATDDSPSSKEASL